MPTSKTPWSLVMSFLVLITVASLLAYVAQGLYRRPRQVRAAMRHGLGLGLLFTGTDHFVSATSRYVPMVPDLLAPLALPLVHLTGAAEIAGALGLLVPLAVTRRLGWPDLQRPAGAALAALFAVMVAANVHVALTGTQVEGLPFGRTYYLLRPWLQPVFIAWALFCVGLLPRRRGPAAAAPAA
jgi:uncharacterized membrane protein